MNQNLPSLPESFNDSFSEDSTFGEGYTSPVAAYSAGDKVIHQSDNDFNTQNQFSAESKKIKPEYCPLTLSTKRSSTNDTSQEQNPDDRFHMITEEKQQTSLSSFTVSDTQNVNSHEDSGIRSTNIFLQMHQKCEADFLLFDGDKPVIEKKNVLNESNSEQLDLNQSDLIKSSQVTLDHAVPQDDSDLEVKDQLEQVENVEILPAIEQGQKSKMNNRYLLNYLLRFIFITFRAIMDNVIEKDLSKPLIKVRILLKDLVEKFVPFQRTPQLNLEFKNYLAMVWEKIFQNPDKNKSTKRMAFELAIQPKYGIMVIKTAEILLSNAYQNVLEPQVVKAQLIMEYWVQQSKMKVCHKENLSKQDWAKPKKEAQEIESFLTIMSEIRNNPLMRCPTEQGTVYERLLAYVWSQYKSGKGVSKSQVSSSPTLSNSQANQADKEKPKGRLTNMEDEDDKLQKRVRT